MTHPARRFRRWVMSAGPAMALAGGRWGTMGAGALLLLWMAAGAVFLGRTRTPFARTRRIGPHRLFLGYAAAVFLLAGLTAAVRRLIPVQQPSPLPMVGAVGFSLILGQRMIRLTLPRGISWSVGSALIAAALILGG